MNHTAFAVSRFENRNGVTSWRVSGLLAGVRIRKNFKTREEAAAEKATLEIKALQIASGQRAIYLYLPQHHTVIFFYVYTKAKSENLTPDQEKRLRAAVETIKREFRHENQGH
jgi:hypothetical protein